ncbi:MAG: molybdenum cofactor guanylyltransferase [Bryobacterales bacterium]|nr:molybdenum cofactor guanylyltransferase [Bryobacterales bacterium]
MPLGYVLVGGASTRMRRDKALLSWYQGPLFAHLCDVLRPFCGEARLLGQDRPEFQGHRVLPDAFPGTGPLGGLASALREAGPEWRLVVSCDAPLVNAALLEELIATAEEQGAALPDAIIPETPDGRLQPLCALWHRRVSATLDRHLESIVREAVAPRSMLSVHRFVETLHVCRFSPSNPGALRNINSMRNYLAALAGRAEPESSSHVPHPPGPGDAETPSGSAK